MAITPVQNLIANVLSGTQSATTSSVASATSATSVSAVQDTQSSSTVTSSVPASLSATVGLQNSAVGLAQLSSLLQEAQSGTQQIGSILQKLQNLAGEAQNGGPPSALAILNGEFQDLISQANQLAAGTSFGGTNLLDGTLSASSADGNSANSLSLPDLTTQGLFGNSTPNILTVQDATAALSALSSASSIAAGASASISGTENQVGYASAGVQTALANNLASASTLTEADLAGLNDNFLNGFGNTNSAAAAQTANLPPSLLSLLQE
jgi:flagellin